MKHWIQLAGLSAMAYVLSAATSFAQEQTAGFVRISDKPAVGQQMQAQAQRAGQPVSYVTSGDCNTGTAKQCDNGKQCQECEECHGVPCLLGLLFPFGCHHGNGQNCPPGASHHDPYQPHCYRNEKGELVCEEPDGWRVARRKAACRYGYFRPQGNCGKGLAPFGHYKHVYSLNPDYFDPRDGQMYAAQGYGTNISVPLAPTVGSVYNYGWGIPSSRQTFVSHRVPLQMPAQNGNSVPNQ